MTLLTCWTRGALVLLALAGGVHAENTVATSADPFVPFDGRIEDYRGQTGPTQSYRDAWIMPDGSVRTTPDPVAAVSSTQITDAWLAGAPIRRSGAEFDCLAKAIYFEARGESVKGQVAVAEVVLNRTENPQFPHTICGVVEQGGSGGCQFSFTCDGLKDRIREKTAYLTAERIASAMMDGANRDLTDGATYFHTRHVRPSWARRFEETALIGDHYFYRQPIRTAMN